MVILLLQYEDGFSSAQRVETTDKLMLLSANIRLLEGMGMGTMPLFLPPVFNTVERELPYLWIWQTTPYEGNAISYRPIGF
ncbi:MAG: hypothetical protein N2Z74_09890 [Syntrophales bacterium]|nr:hypothetical protein [Syntrophales bacterium]